MSMRHRVRTDKAQARYADAHMRTIHDFLESCLALQPMRLSSRGFLVFIEGNVGRRPRKLARSSMSIMAGASHPHKRIFFITHASDMANIGLSVCIKAKSG